MGLLPGGCLLGLALKEVSGSGLLPRRSLAHFGSVEVVASGLLGPVSAEVSGLNLVPWKVLAWASSCSGHWLRSGLLEVAGSALFPQMSDQVPWSSLAHPCFLRGPRSSLAQPCSLRCCSFIPAPVEVAGSAILWWVSLAWACSYRDHLLGPALKKGTVSGLVPQRLSGQACSLGGCSLGLALKEVSVSGLVQQRSLARASVFGFECFFFCCLLWIHDYKSF